MFRTLGLKADADATVLRPPGLPRPGSLGWSSELRFCFDDTQNREPRPRLMRRATRDGAGFDRILGGQPRFPARVFRRAQILVILARALHPACPALLNEI